MHLHLRNFTWENHKAPLIPFHRLSPTVRSLHLTYTSFEVFDLVCSFPLLEDLPLISTALKSGAVGQNTPVLSLKLTGTLTLKLLVVICPVIGQLLDLPNGLHFMKVMYGASTKKKPDQQQIYC